MIPSGNGTARSGLLVIALTSCADVADATGPSCGAALASSDLGVIAGNTTVFRLHATHFGAQSTVPPAGCGASGAARRALLRYVTRGTGRVVVSWRPSVAAATDLWVSLACDAAAPPLVCEGSFRTQIASPSRIVATRSVPTGTSLSIVLATSSPTGVLEVTEVVDEVPLGGRCDGLIRANRCVDGASCASGTCVPRGVMNAGCRREAPRCDPGLACSVASAPDGRCVPAVVPGALCPTFGAPCEGGHCVISEGQLRCVRDGVTGGACRTTGAPCEEGLGCLNGSCVRRVAAGAPCGPPVVPSGMCPEGEACSTTFPQRCVPSGAAESPCRAERPHCNVGFICRRDPMFPSSGSCIAQGEAPSRCRPGESSSCPAGAVCAGPVDAPRCVWPGAAGGLCDLHERCDDGLVCVPQGINSRSECVTPGAPGELCRLLQAGSSCAAPADCLEVDGRQQCVAEGSSGGPCRGGATPCEPGLRCNHQRRCAPPVEASSTCDPEGARDACPDGHRCVGGSCVAPGAPGGFCRVTAPSCARGLRCDRDRAASAVCVEG